jgi:hypothetical protein
VCIVVFASPRCKTFYPDKLLQNRHCSKVPLELNVIASLSASEANLQQTKWEAVKGATSYASNKNTTEISQSVSEPQNT